MATKKWLSSLEYESDDTMKKDDIHLYENIW